MMKYYLIFAFIGLSLNFSSIAQKISSAQSGNWNSPSTWSGGIVPGPFNLVTIGSGHTITVTSNVICNSIVFEGDWGGIDISNGSSLITSSVTVKSLATLDVGFEIYGGGTLSCTGDLTIGTTVIPSAGMIRTTMFSTYIDTISIGGNVIFNASMNGTMMNNPGFFIDGSHAVIEGQISFSSIPASSLSSVYFFLDNGDLNLLHESPWCFHPSFLASTGWGSEINNGANFHLGLNGNNSTVIYGRNGSQIINRESVVNGHTVSINYNHLVLKGSGNKTLPLSSNLNIEGSLVIKDNATFTGNTITYSDDVTLVYQGQNLQTTSDSEFPQDNGPRNVIIDNPEGVILNNNKMLRAGIPNKLYLRQGTINNSTYNITLNDESEVIINNGSLCVTPNYGQTINITYDENLNQIVTGAEIPDSNSVINRINIHNKYGVAFNKQLTICIHMYISDSAKLFVKSGKAITITDSLINMGFIILQSDSNGTATILNSKSDGDGEYIAEQYLTGSGGSIPDGRMWYVGSPVQNAVSNSVEAGGNNKLWFYTEEIFSYTEINNDTTILQPGSGYVVRTGATQIYPFIGNKFNSGDYLISSLTRTGTSNSKRGYHLISNPYPSFLDWKSTITSNLVGTIWIRTVDLSSVHVFDTYNSISDEGTNNNGNGAVNRYISPFQAFWVKVDEDGNTGSVFFCDSLRSHQSSNLLKSNNQNNTLRIRISNSQYSDEAIILFNEDAGSGVNDWDSEKMFNSSQNIPQIWTNDMNQNLVINSQNEITDNLSIPLFFNIPPLSSGNHKFSFDLDRFDNFTIVYLEDTELNVYHDVRSGNYNFISTSIQDSSRFILHFNPLPFPNQIFIIEEYCDQNFLRIISKAGFKNTDMGLNVTLSDTEDKLKDMGKLFPFECEKDECRYIFHFPANQSNWESVIIQYNTIGISSDEIIIWPIACELYPNIEKNVGVFPNPFTNTFEINGIESMAEEILVKVYNTSGKEVYSNIINPQERIKIDLSFLTNGVYVLTLQCNQFQLNRQIIKIENEIYE